MKTETIISILIGISLFLIIIAVTILVLSKMPSTDEFNRQTELTYAKCCGGNVCTDTYYNEADGKCHSTFEYQNVFYKWYVTIPLILGVLIILGLVVQFIVPKEETLRSER